MSVTGSLSSTAMVLAGPRQRYPHLDCTAAELTAHAAERDQEVILGMIPLARHGRPEEMAHAIRFLLDDQAGYVTAAVTVVDGGLIMGS